MAVDPVSVGIKVALMAAQMAMTAMTKIEGPRLDSLDATTADYGTPIISFWGRRRLEGVPIFWAEKLREKKTTTKTKGGKYAEYKYFGTFAVLIADHAIDKVSRIWMDKHLVYDVTSAGPISVAGAFFQGLRAPVKLANGRNMRIYDGTQTGPDPRMESWCEDRYGADSCPAYKDVSYIVFQDLPLEKFGNRIPQVTVEAVNDSNVNFLWEDAPEESSLAGDIQFSPDYSRFYCDGSIWDTATRTRIANILFEPEALGTGGVAWNITDAIGAGGGPFLYRYTNDGQYWQGPYHCPATCTFAQSFSDNTCFIGSSISTTYQIFESGAVAAFDVDYRPTAFEQDSDGNVWTCGTPSASTTIHLECVFGPRLGETTTVVAGNSGYPHLFINSSDQFILELDGELYKLDNDLAQIDSAVITSTGTFSYQRGSDTFWRCPSTTASEYSLNDLTLIRTVNASSWVGAPGGFDSGVYDPVTHAIITKLTGHIVHSFLDRVGSNGTLLANVVSDVAGWCGVDDFDVSDLDQTVPGYSVTQGSGKDMLGPLLDIHDVDARPHDFEVQFLKRGNASAGTIDVSEFVREGDEARYTISIAQDTDLPRQISLSFADGDKDQQSNTVLFQRPNVSIDTVRTQQIDLTTYVSTPGDAQKFVDRYGRRKWNGRETISNALTSQYLGLEPGDVYTLALDDVSQSARLTKMTISQGRLNTEWERDFASLNLLGTGTGAAMDGRDDDVIFVPSPTKGFVLDIPLVQDSHDVTVPQVYYGAGDYDTGDWPGAGLYQADVDGDEYFAWNAVDAADKAVWGYATEILPDADPWCWDRGSSVKIGVKGTLTSSTEAAINASPIVNLAYLGGELLNFVTATLEADGTYTLSGLLRGRRGTEGACSTHAIGEEFVLVSDLARDGFGLSDVGTDFSFKAQTLGRDVDSAAVIEVDFSGASLKPYAPARVRWYFDGTDMQGTITRRTRVGGSWVGGTTIPLSEASEAYEIEVYSGATLKRTISVSGTNTFTYTHAQMVTDFGADLTSAPTFIAYQLSDAVGRGFALAA